MILQDWAAMKEAMRANGVIVEEHDGVSPVNIRIANWRRYKEMVAESGLMEGEGR